VKIKEAAERCGVSRQTLYKWLDSGFISTLDIENEGFLEAWIEENTVTVTRIDPYTAQTKVTTKHEPSEDDGEILKRIQELRESGLGWRSVVSKLVSESSEKGESND